MHQIDSILQGNCIEVLKTLPDNSVDCVVTSPPYWQLRSYLSTENSDKALELGAEATPEEYVDNLVAVFREVKRILKPEGTVWLNLGDSYAGSGHGYLSIVSGKQATNHGTDFMVSKPPAVVPHGLKSKDLVGIPFLVAFALREGLYKCSACGDKRRGDQWYLREGERICVECLIKGQTSKVELIEKGFYLRQDIIWQKNNAMPESVSDRCTKAHEYIFLMSKNSQYQYDADAIKEVANYDGRKDTVLKGSPKYADGEHSTSNVQSFAVTARERWLLNADGVPVRNKRSVWSVDCDNCDRCHEYLFLLAKNAQYQFDSEAIKEDVAESTVVRLSQDIANQRGSDRVPGKTNGAMKAVGNTDKRNKRSVWTVNTKPFKEAHFATYPEELITPCILAGCPEGGIVLDPFMGSGTTAIAAIKNKRHYIGIELSAEYVVIAEQRIKNYIVPEALVIVEKESGQVNMLGL